MLKKQENILLKMNQIKLKKKEKKNGNFIINLNIQLNIIYYN